jgi:predicted ATP-grasp superfamily ATP-dependent carboligase
MRPLTAFVTDGDQRPALAITRSLGRHGIAVVVGAEQADSLASASKYCVRHVTYPSPVQHPDAFERFLLDFVEREHVDVVMPVTDVTTHLVASNSAALSHFTATAVPACETFDFVSNKSLLLQRAGACGVSVPRTHFVDHRDGLPALLDQIEYPAVIKPARSRIRTHAGWLSTSVQYADTEPELLRKYRDVEYLAAYPSMIQERIVGPGVGVFVLCDRGELRAAFAHRRLREKPPSGGVSVLCESVALDPRLLDDAMKLLRPLAWHGVAMMEFKQDRGTGRAFLMEVNGRFWGSLQLAVDAGVDFPWLSYRLALDRPIAGPQPYRVGLKSRWLLGDLDHLIMRLFHSDDHQHLPEGMPSRLGALREFVQPAGRSVRYDVISREDRRPFRYEAQQYCRHLFASAAQTPRKLFAASARNQPRCAATHAPAMK